MTSPFITENTGNVTRADLVQHLAGELKDLTLGECKALVDGFFDVIADRLVEGQAVRINGLGTFEVRQKRERPGRNLHTGEEVTIRARRVVLFHPAPTLRDRVTATMLEVND